jgi:hypothetical protein
MDELLASKNKFLREVEAAPKARSNEVILPWSVSQANFSTVHFHPRKLQHRLSVEDVKKVAVAEQVVKYLKLVPNFHVYNSLKWLILLPSSLLAVFMYLILRVLPSKMAHQGKLAMALFGTAR